MIRIIIVDDHPFMRAGIRSELATRGGFMIVDEATDGDEAVQKTRTWKPDLLILDISLPKKNGLDVLKIVRQELPQVRVLMLSNHPEKEYAIRCFRCGAHGYLKKESTSADLYAAIRKIMAGGKYVSPELSDILASTIPYESGKMLHENLSDREFQVLCMIGQGNKLSEIADILSISLSTVNTYRVRIRTKLYLSSNAQLIRYVHEHNLTEHLKNLT